MTPIDRKDRVLLAQLHYGLYTIGFAITDSERVDEDCCMDNCGVPYYTEKLSLREQDLIELYGRKNEQLLPG